MPQGYRFRRAKARRFGVVTHPFGDVGFFIWSYNARATEARNAEAPSGSATRKEHPEGVRGDAHQLGCRESRQRVAVSHNPASGQPGLQIPPVSE
jgi:hypothetical protein